MHNYYYIADMSYIIFNAAYSSFKNYDKQFNLSNSTKNQNFDPTTDEEYNYMFKESLIRALVTPAQQAFPFIDKSKFIFCIDCHRKDIWRRDIYPDYKMNRDTRDKSKDEFSIGKVFQYAYDFLVPAVKDEFNCIQVGCGCAEADDVIATLTKKLIADNPNNKVVVITSDRDMVQLCNDQLMLITAQCKVRSPKEDLANMIHAKEEDIPDIDSKDFLLFKIILGDPSDNIPHIKPGVGPKKAYNLMMDKQLLKETLQSSKEVYDSFIRNKQLISMNEIPQDITNMILEEYKNALQLKENNATII